MPTRSVLSVPRRALVSVLIGWLFCATAAAADVQHDIKVSSRFSQPCSLNTINDLTIATWLDYGNRGARLYAAAYGSDGRQRWKVQLGASTDFKRTPLPGCSVAIVPGTSGALEAWWLQARSGKKVEMVSRQLDRLKAKTVTRKGLRPTYAEAAIGITTGDLRWFQGPGQRGLLAAYYRGGSMKPTRYALDLLERTADGRWKAAHRLPSDVVHIDRLEAASNSAGDWVVGWHRSTKKALS